MPDESLTMFRTGFRRRLREATRERDIESIARATGVPKSEVAAYLAGEAEPSVDWGIALCSRESISIDWLLTGRGKHKWSADSAG